MDNYYNDISLFRFSIIAPIITETHGYDSINQYLDFVVQQKYYFQGKDYKIGKTTIKRWLKLYRKEGLNGLSKKTRSDKKASRNLNNETIQRILSLREQYPKITATAIYKILIKETYIDATVSLASIMRYIRNNNLKAGQVCGIERRMFEMENVNDCWQADTSVGPYIKINGIKYKTYIIMFIDDKSRMIMGYDVFFNDNAINMQKVFKKAIKTYGKPKRLFVDNGGPYANKQLTYICASLGLELIHAKPYTPEAKAKQERLFRTIKDGWMRCCDWNEFKSLEDVRNSLNEFIINEYINKKHSVTKETPNDRWHNEIEKIIRLEDKKIDESFMHQVTYKVRKDRTIKFQDEYYEIPFKYVGQVILLRYNPLDYEKLYLYEDKEFICEINKVDKVSNSKVKRQNKIDYTNVLNDEIDVIEKEEEKCIVHITE